MAVALTIHRDTKAVYFRAHGDFEKLTRGELRIVLAHEGKLQPVPDRVLPLRAARETQPTDGGVPAVR